jgi:hypothetical protein
MHCTRLKADLNFKFVHHRLDMPFLFSNRSFFNCYYQVEGDEPGERTFMISGLGNQAV